MKASQLRRDFFGVDSRITEPGAIRSHEAWWVERQESLERAGYMLRPRFRPGWKPSWAGTRKYHGRFEDGKHLRVRADALCLSVCAYEISATRMH
jgi:hypothetical protein